MPANLRKKVVMWLVRGYKVAKSAIISHDENQLIMQVSKMKKGLRYDILVLLDSEHALVVW